MKMPTQTTTMAPFFLLLATLTVATSGQIISFKCVSVEKLFPTGCTCTTPSEFSVEPIMDCSNLGLTSVPTPTGPMEYTLYDFKLNNNRITSLTAENFQNLQTTAINLLDNPISSVTNDAFRNLIEPLTTLKLSGDGTNLPPKASFPSLSQLLHLHLKGYNVPDLHHLPEEGDPHAVFVSLTSLKSLTLEGWNLAFVEPDSFEGPQSLEELNLINQKFPNILSTRVRDITSLKKLTVSNTISLDKLTPSSLNTLTSLKTLDLSHNGINTIEDNAFGGLVSLESVSISHNLLQSQDIGTISGLPNLQSLDMSNNEQLSSLPELRNLNSRQLTLDISHCGLTQLSASEMDKMPANLDTLGLDLSNNKIANIDDETFQNMAQLRKLVIAHQSFASGALHVPSSIRDVPLTDLDLSGQPLVPDSVWAVVSNTRSLLTLDLSSTDLTSIPDLAFQNLDHLEELHFAFNGLTELTQKALVGPRASLKKLSLSGNQFQIMPFCSLHQYQLPPVLEIAIEPNNLNCDCTHGWVQDYQAREKIKFTVPPTCPDERSLVDVVANCPQTTERCTDYYQNEPDPPLPREKPDVNITMGTLGDKELTVTWVISSSTVDLSHFEIHITNPQSQTVFVETATGITRRVDTPPVPDGVVYTVCIKTIFPDLQATDCTSYHLQGDTDPEPQSDDDDDDSTGIIIGVVIAAVVLIGVLIVIGYIVFLRRKPKGPTEQPRQGQPRTYTKSELPSMAGKEGMQVVAISDGMAHNNGNNDKPPPYQGGSSHGPARVGRAHLLVSEGSSYKDMTDLKPPSSSGSVRDSYDSDPYDNDRGRGPLPRPPRTRGQQPALADTNAYYNEAFDSKYDEIEPTKPMATITTV